jgi:hypothetical protein
VGWRRFGGSLDSAHQRVDTPVKQFAAVLSMGLLAACASAGDSMTVVAWRGESSELTFPVA